MGVAQTGCKQEDLTEDMLPTCLQVCIIYDQAEGSRSTLEPD